MSENDVDLIPLLKIKHIYPRFLSTRIQLEAVTCLINTVHLKWNFILNSEFFKCNTIDFQ